MFGKCVVPLQIEIHDIIGVCILLKQIFVLFMSDCNTLFIFLTSKTDMFYCIYLHKCLFLYILLLSEQVVTTNYLAIYNLPGCCLDRNILYFMSDWFIIISFVNDSCLYLERR